MSTTLVMMSTGAPIGSNPMLRVAEIFVSSPTLIPSLPTSHGLAPLKTILPMLKRHVGARMLSTRRVELIKLMSSLGPSCVPQFLLQQHQLTSSPLLYRHQQLQQLQKLLQSAKICTENVGRGAKRARGAIRRYGAGITATRLAGDANGISAGIWVMYQ